MCCPRCTSHVRHPKYTSEKQPVPSGENGENEDRPWTTPGSSGTGLDKVHPSKFNLEKPESWIRKKGEPSGAYVR